MNIISPVPNDEVWMLEGITWGGVFHKRLRQNNVRNVQDFLKMLAVKSDELRMVNFSVFFFSTAFDLEYLVIYSPIVLPALWSPISFIFPP